jgi:soluble lytic murein transglycosylase
MSRAIIRAASAVFGLALLAGHALADQKSAFRDALAASAAGDWTAALTAAKGAAPEGGDVILWQWLRASQGTLGDYESFLARRPDWPGLPLLKERGELAVARSTDPARVLAYFGADLPQTGTGAVAYIRALDALGRTIEAEAEALRAWATLKFTAEDQANIMALHGPALGVIHELRLDRILWDGERQGEAARMLPLVSKGWQAMATARMALRADKDGVNALIAAVPGALQDDSGLAYERFIFRMRADNYADATTLILERSDSAGRLGDPEAWAARRILLTRWLMRNGRAEDAFRVASGHQMTKGDGYAELEFLAGFVALRKLGDPERALKHFTLLKASVVTPISLARADYWIARAHEAAGDSAGATAAYQSAAQYHTAYYGLLAAEKLGLSLDPALISDAPPNGDWRSEPWAASSVLTAARQLSAVGDRTQAKRFILHLAESLDDRQLALLAETAFEMNEPHIAVLIGKRAADRGLILPRPYFPMPSLVPDTLPVSRALALAISRRESEFDTNARSPAGAQGLMQLMPGTAKDTAKKLGLEYQEGWLTSDPAYNVTLGSAFLRQLADEFGPSIALIASGYNAGSRRPREWVATYGDIRNGADPVDWVESIPFAETRTYVMRVTEGVVIYRARLKGVAGPVRILSELTGN